MDKIVLFTTGCPKCRVIESKLASKGVAFEKVDDIDRMEQAGVRSVPSMLVDGRLMAFKEANDYVNSL